MISRSSRLRLGLQTVPSSTSGALTQAGFTLLEVLVVLVILGLLAAVVAGPQIFKHLGTAKSEAAKVQVQQISQALDLYRLEIGRYPTQEESLVALIEQPPGLTKWDGPYMKKGGDR